MKKLFVIILIALNILQIQAQQKRAMTVEDLWNMKRINNYDVSPDGKTIAFAVTSYSMDSNKGNSDIYLIDADGKNLRPFKNTNENESEPKFSPDGKKIAYEFKDQIWIADLDGSRHEVDLSLVANPAVGDYVIIHAGYAIERLDEDEARERMALFEELAASWQPKSP